MAETVIRLRLNQQQLELLDRTIAQGVPRTACRWYGWRCVNTPPRIKADAPAGATR